ncbi:hypothetical protein [Streptomyces sp. ODS28]|uniref:hypothetical protein n=1 Tax=Streptomyces sp. ODS28 TaxID=3136688 RepID=UPI0031E73250
MTAAAVAGVLVGTGVTAWQTGAVSLGGREVCWGALSEGEARRLLDRRIDAGEDLTHAELPISDTAPGDYRMGRGMDGTCQFGPASQGAGDSAQVRLHELDSRIGSDPTWANAFLSARLTPLGSTLRGMASDDHAWLALPESCVRPGLASGPTVVDIALEGGNTPDDPDPGKRQAMARAVVRVANAVQARQGCRPLPEPKPAEARKRVVADRDDPAAGCGLAPGREPHRAKGDDNAAYFTVPSGGPVRGCTAIRDGLWSPRLTTVTYPRLALLFDRASGSEEKRFTHKRGEEEDRGFLRRGRAVFHTQCHGRSVAFTAENGDAGQWDLRRMFHDYVAAEAQRLGCGDIDLRLPRP